MDKEKVIRRSGILLLILGTLVLFAGLWIRNQAENTYYETQFDILVIWCILYGFAFLTIGIIFLNVKTKIKWLLVAIVCLLLLLLTPIQTIDNDKNVVEYKAFLYSVTVTVN